MVVPHSGQVPFSMTRPFFVVVFFGSTISRLSLHFMQWAITFSAILAPPSSGRFRPCTSTSSHKYIETPGASLPHRGFHCQWRLSRLHGSQALNRAEKLEYEIHALLQCRLIKVLDDIIR